MATKFDDLSKTPRSCLVDDYTTSFVLKTKKLAGDVLVTIETERTDKGTIQSKVASKFAYAKFNVDKAQHEPDGGKVFESSIKLSPEVKMFFKAKKGADLGIEYVQGNFYGTTQVDVLDMSNISSTACLALQSGVKIGGSTAYNLQGSKGFQGFNVGVSYTQGPLFASLQANQASQFNVGVLYQVNKDLALASMSTHSKDKPFELMALGGTVKVPAGILKAKVSGSGVVSASLIREIAPKVMLTASGTVSPSDLNTFKPGIQIEM